MVGTSALAGTLAAMGYQHLEVEQEGRVATLWLNRPEKLNAFSEDMWDAIPAAMSQLDADDSVRAVIVAGRGNAFTVGIDIGFLSGLLPEGESPAIKNEKIYRLIRRMQWTNSVFAKSPKPVIAAIHGYCLGQGINLITACDIRLAAADAVIGVRETKLAITADVGVLQRLPAIVGAGRAAEMALTGRDFTAQEAAAMGLLNHVYPDQESLLVAARALAAEIAANSPLVTRGVKTVLGANDGRTVEEALEFVARWNSAYLISNDLFESLAAQMEKRDPDFKGN